MFELKNMNLENKNLVDLKDFANAEHKLAWVEFLDHAHGCGQALREIKRRHKHGEWKKLFDDNTFDFSYPTAAAYMRIAKHWHDPDIKEAREQGKVDSIQSFLEMLSGLKKKKNGKKTKKQPTDGMTPLERQEYDKALKTVCKEFRQHIKDMSPDEVQIMYERFDEFWHGWKAQVHAALKLTPKADAA